MDHALPAQVSANGRYFVDRAGRPCFWLGDTQWNLFRCHDLPTARLILDDRRLKGFNVVQVMGPGCARDVQTAPVFGEAFPDQDLSRPNAAYFANMDQIIEYAGQIGIALAIGLDHPVLRLTNLANARTYGRWIGQRYRHHAHLIWIPTYIIPDQEHLPVMRELVAGLREGGSQGLCSSHPDPAIPTASSSIAHSEPWLAFNSIQTFKSTHLLYQAVQNDYNLTPPKPVVMAEGAYEAGSEYGFPVNPLWVRRQAYWSYLAGGHHSYGHNDAWRVLPSWLEALDAPGAHQLTVLKEIFTGIRWWELQPDQSLFAEGAGQGNFQNAAAVAAGRDWALVYLSHPGPIGLRLDTLKTTVSLGAQWLDPRDGSAQPAGPLSGAQVQALAPPPGWEDALLLIQSG
ncbi:MAG: DUF4038 domain-containing protein [Candidatus Latescibacteria bacterium]|nr:DUF4038 domain-containing protein [Candidatus Latescibacterota bacterium]